MVKVMASRRARIRPLHSAGRAAIYAGCRPITHQLPAKLGGRHPLLSRSSASCGPFLASNIGDQCYTVERPKFEAIDPLLRETPSVSRTNRPVSLG